MSNIAIQINYFWKQIEKEKGDKESITLNIEYSPSHQETITVSCKEDFLKIFQYPIITIVN